MWAVIGGGQARPWLPGWEMVWTKMPTATGTRCWVELLDHNAMYVRAVSGVLDEMDEVMWRL